MQVASITLPVQYSPTGYAPFLDTTGNEAANLVVGEEQVFSANTGSPYTFIMPSFGPFYANTLVVKIKNSLGLFVTKVLGVDYHLAYPFLGASRAIGQPIFAGIKFSSIVEETTVQLSYHSLGGIWINRQDINASVMLNELRNPCAVALEQVVPYSQPFPIITQPWDRADATGMPEVIDEIELLTKDMADRSLGMDYQDQIEHISRIDNPHQTTAVQVNLGLVSNLPAASDTSAQDSENNSEYINTAQVHAMMLTGLTHAEATVRGGSALNLGANVGDDDNATNALTASGFTTIISNPDSAINRAFNKGQLSKSVTPFPFTYPVTWNGEVYANQAAFVAAVEAYVGVSPLEYNAGNGTYWFPANTVLPPLTVA